MYKFALIAAAMAIRVKDDESLLKTTDDATAEAAPEAAAAVATDDASASADPSYLSEQKLDGGITINTLAQGSGTCGAGQTAAVEYTGALAQNGNVFDTSVGKDPISFVIGDMTMVKCWEQALPQMAVGQKADLGCPASTAYGGSSKPGIPANSDLIFNVEVKSCQ